MVNIKSIQVKFINYYTSCIYLTTLILFNPITSVLNFEINLFSSLSSWEALHDLMRPSLNAVRDMINVLFIAVLGQGGFPVCNILPLPVPLEGTSVSIHPDSYHLAVLLKIARRRRILLTF